MRLLAEGEVSCIADALAGSLIKSKYQNGVPVAGLSAGALVSQVHCIIPPVDTPKTGDSSEWLSSLNRL